MEYSTLYNAIARGKWFITLRDLEMKARIIDGLLEHSEQRTGELKDREKMIVRIGKKISSMAQKNNFDDATPGSTAIINLHGDMLKYGTFCSYGTNEIASKIYEAADSKNIDGIILDIDSGGGCVDAIAPVTDAISYAQDKGVFVIAHCDLCASAAYYVACFCDNIIAANNISSEFGSIGVMMTFPDYAKYYESKGIKIHTIYSNLSDYKNAPFESALKGEYDKIKLEELDPLAKGFQETVKSKRKDLNLKIDGIINGRMFYSLQAKEYGLIDGIGDVTYCLQKINELKANATVENYLRTL